MSHTVLGSRTDIKIAVRRDPLRRYRGRALAILFVLPALVVFGVFAWYPMVLGLVLSFYRVRLGIGKDWIGLSNFHSIVSDDLFWKSAFNTLEFVLLALIFGYLVPVVVALGLTEIRTLRAFFRLCIYLPNVIPAIAVYIMWNWVFHPEAGLLNMILRSAGLPTLEWLLSPITAMPSLVLMATWAGFGSTAVLYMAALSNFPLQLYEAAEIDGAGILHRLLYVTLPQLKPIMLIMLILQLLFTFQVFQEPFVMTGGGPNNSTMTILYMVYRYAFTYFEFGKASALGTLLFAFLALLSAVYLRLARSIGE